MRTPELSAAEAARIRMRLTGMVTDIGSQEAVAETLGVHQTAVSKILRGECSAGLRIVRAVARWLGVSMDSLLDDGRP